MLPAKTSAVKDKLHSSVFPVRRVLFDGKLLPVLKDAEALLDVEFRREWRTKESNCECGKRWLSPKP